MDPADRDTVSHALTSQERKIQAHETQLNTIATGVKQLTERQDHFQQEVVTQVNQLNAQLQQISIRLEQLASPQPPQPTTPVFPQPASPTPPVTSPPRPVRLAPPEIEKYSGESSECRSFLVQCNLHFKNDPAAFSSEQAQVAFMVSHLSGRAVAWAMAEWARGAAVCQSTKQFVETLTRLFDHSSPAREALRALLGLGQRSRRVIDYAIEFRTLAANSGCNSPAIKDVFINRLNENIKDQLAPQETPAEFKDLI
ncbi:hypothetical protein L3Q82_007876 [Scortum barcoo]|uniref:Uncharacterized protein n=1 Tax=Scortum barcoo TaxID=214431 RepID=A0ACB8WL04_9TELE|nr:hypothetical protein L3Q82_007876 [Scortum barcoo]